LGRIAVGVGGRFVPFSKASTLYFCVKNFFSPHAEGEVPVDRRVKLEQKNA